jgi:hypothetical protein
VNCMTFERRVGIGCLGPLEGLAKLLVDFGLVILMSGQTHARAVMKKGTGWG